VPRLRTRRCPLKRFIAGLCLLVLVPLGVPAEERVDLDMVTRIRQEEFKHSQVMETASELMDRIGPRLTGSPQMKEANEWTKSKLAEWGLANAHLESWGPFGRGWQYESCAVRMTAPDHAELLALPQAWTPGTNGVVKGSVIRVNPQSKDDLDKYKGQVAGKIVLWGDVREVPPHTKPDLTRYDEKSLAEVTQYEMPGGPPRYPREEYRRRYELRRAAEKFFEQEKPAVIIDLGRGDFGTFAVPGGGEYRTSKPKTAIPSLEMESEHFGRIARLLDRHVDVQLEIEVRTKFIDENQMQWNTIAELPGGDRKDEVVMIGAHLDSWHTATGATDNADGVTTVMEAMRILKVIAARPRRTIRVALWGGEEQGLVGSRAWVKQHLAGPENAAAREKFDVYLNIDNGTGPIYGWYLENREALLSLFDQWLKPLREFGARRNILEPIGATDHVSFNEVGVPGFNPIQDYTNYDTRTHHTNMDTADRVEIHDIHEATLVMAWFAYQAAMADQKIPRARVE